MREIDSETSVVWPAWCYSGETAMSEDPSQTPSAGLMPTSTNNNKSRAKRKADMVMLSSSHHEDKKSNDILANENRGKSANNMKMLKHFDANLDIKSLNDSQTQIYDIKNERISPNTNENQSIFSPSRSVTPSSFSGTPPHLSNEPMNTLENANSSNLTQHHNSQNSEFQARNYSDYIRSLAAKYNTFNSNDFSNIPVTIPKSNSSNSKSVRDTLNLADVKLVGNNSPIAKQISNQFSSLFSGLPLQTAAFPSLVDMSSTQALVALAKLAKEAEIEQILRGPSKVPLKPKIPSSIAQQLASSLSSSSSSPLLANSEAIHLPLTAAAAAINPLISKSNTTSITSTPLSSSSAASGSSDLSTPLDLSSSPVCKKIKLTANNLTTPEKCRASSDEINGWTVDQVCEFVGSIDICAEYVQNFRDQSIDGIGLPLLTEEHLINSLGMKLGPVLKLKSFLAKKMRETCNCSVCTGGSATAVTTNDRPRSTDSGS